MSSPTTPEPNTPVTAPATETKPDVEPPAQEVDWKAEARKWEQRAKDNSTAAARLAEIEEASKTEAQKLAERAEKAEKALADREARDALAAMRAEVAKESEVPESALRGSTREELEAHAAELKPLITSRLVIPSQGDVPPSKPEGAAEQFAQFLTEQLDRR